MASRREFELAHGEVSRLIIASFYHVYNATCPKLAESIYQNAMPIALEMRGLRCAREVPMEVRFEGVNVGYFRADLVVEGLFLVELKSADTLLRTHEAQVYNYLRISRLPIGMLMNFGPRPQIRRLVIP